MSQICAIFVIVFAATTARAANSFAHGVEFVPLQQRAQGESLVGGNLMNDSLYANPAGSAFMSVYSVDANFTSPRSFAVSVLDTRTSAIGGALGYFRTNAFTGNQDPFQGFKGALFGRVSEEFALGISGKTMWGPNLTGARSRLTDIDFGALADFKVIQLGFTARNIFGGDPSLGEPAQWSIGGRINYENTLFFSVATQSTWTRFSPNQIGVGAEYVSPYYFAVKGGFRHRPDDGQSFWGAGLSINSPRLSVHYAVEIPQSGGTPEHIVGSTLLF